MHRKGLRKKNMRLFLSFIRTSTQIRCAVWHCVPQRRYFCDEKAAVEKSLNQVTLLGRVGIEPQLRGSDSNPVVVFTLATNSNYKYETGEVEQKTQWHRISVFKPFLRNSVYQFLRKGTRIFVQGRLMYGHVTDAKGVEHITTTIVAEEVIFLAGGKMPEEKSLLDSGGT
ncbi:single-stranded DNA-binding protein, mitochondrial-like [Ornithodoros turicata]|uniref:single-stranded DNA-binding protein, mitochondrial-like n=1 Tax=Ornithodoros turicata TaxID=34597 RepID=UPI003139E7E9